MNAAIDMRDFIAGLRVGEGLLLEGLALVPLCAEARGAASDTVFLDESLAEGHTHVTEVSESGVVARVRVSHGGKRALLVLAGEQLLGAKQNRVFNASFVVAPGTDVELPVSCVEQNRWHHTSSEFRAGSATLAASLRGSKLKRVVESVRGKGKYDAQQREVWGDVSRHLERTQTISSTSSYDDAYLKSEKDIEAQITELRPLEDQVGVAVLVNGGLVMLDVFPSPALFERAWKKCVRGALAERGLHGDAQTSPRAAKAVVEATLRQIATAAAATHPSPAANETLTGTTPTLSFSAATWQGHVVHFAAAG